MTAVKADKLFQVYVGVCSAEAVTPLQGVLGIEGIETHPGIFLHGRVAALVVPVTAL